MPDPRDLKVGDRVRFVALPEEWSQPNCFVHDDDRAFMEAMINRRFSSRVYKIDEYGIPLISARLKVGDRYEWHTWGIFETTGWRKVQKRKASAGVADNRNIPDSVG